jgi:N-acetylmuramoyl-L-alanine amidase
LIAFSIGACAATSNGIMNQSPANDEVPLMAPSNPEFSQKLQQGLLIVYPPDKAVIKATSSFLIGSVKLGNTLTCNGEAVPVNNQGFFAHQVPLNPGENSFRLVSSSGNEQTVKLIREGYSNLPTDKATIDTSQAKPAQDLTVTAGDTIIFAIRANIGATAQVKFGKRMIDLKPLSQNHTTAINTGDTAYGVVVDQGQMPAGEIYTGIYKVQAHDLFKQEHPLYNLHWHNTKSPKPQKLTWRSPNTIDTLIQPILAQTKHDNTIVRLGPGLSRVTPLASGIGLTIDGKFGPWSRISLAPNQHRYIETKDLEMNNSAQTSQGISTINLEESDNATKVIIPLSNREPYHVEQTTTGLNLFIYGVTANTDWITPAHSQLSSAVKDLRWCQPADGIYQVTVELRKHQQWGYQVNFAENNLVLTINKAPKLPNLCDQSETPSQTPLTGLKICLDPGHGDKETGSMGPSGIPESAINLAISLQLRKILESKGARVIMTRTSQNENPDLSKRVQIAEDSGCQLLLSIHNNALPDGRDPLKEHGSSTYYYHPQSKSLAQYLRNSLVSHLGFPDWGVYYQNLAMARTPRMPSVLAEIGFMINPDEYGNLISPATQTRAAQALANGIEAYLRNNLCPKKHK